VSGEEALDNAASAAETTLVADALTPEARRGLQRGGVGTCANCGAPLEGPYCHACGQYDDDLRRPIWTLASEVVEGLFSVDGRVWRTVPPLLFQPGVATRRYLEGERARYVAPFRLYLVASLIFFLVLAVVGEGVTFDPQDAATAEQTQQGLDRASQEIAEARAQLESDGDRQGADELRNVEDAMAGLTDALTGSDMQALEGQAQELSEAARKPRWKDEDSRSFLPEDYPEQAQADAAESDEDGPNIDVDFVEQLSREQREWIVVRVHRLIDDPGRLNDAMARWAPRMLFVLLPVYALLLALTHIWRRDFILFDHLVVTLHFHAFLFTLMAVLMIVQGLITTGIAILILLVWSNFYLYRLHRRVYRHGRFMSLFRTAIMDIAYFIVLLIATIALFFLGFTFA